MGETERPTSNAGAVVQSFQQNGRPGEIASAVPTEEADRLRDSRQYTRAAKAYEELLERAPLRTDIRVQYGNMLKDSGRLDEAEATYRAALAQVPDDADTYLQLGHALKLQGRRSVAIAAYRRAAELAPFAPEPMRELALADAEEFIDGLPEPFRTRVRDCYRGLDAFEQAGYVPPHAYVGRTVLDWEAGDCAWSVVFLLKGARHVTAIDSYNNGEVASKALKDRLGFSFQRASAEAFAKLHAETHGNHFDFVFANTVTEHIQNLPLAFDALKRVMGQNGLFFCNHDNYYSPSGSHDHGFWLFGSDNYVTFQGTDCWASEEKCEKSSAHRRSVIEKLPWTWSLEIDARLTPENCANCPYYKRSQPWGHLAYAHEFLTVYPEPGMRTGRDRSSLNKITPFQLSQFLTEAGFQILKSKRNFVKNVPPPELLDLGISLDDLTTGAFFVLAEVH
jgi:2-polyprenyl-3-methyl-5-hydroxy-6-metoxy-1,4-benzoquinol methylase